VGTGADENKAVGMRLPIRSTFVLISGIALAFALSLIPGHNVMIRFLFTRPGVSDKGCVPDTDDGPALPKRPLTTDELHAFKRDGSVVLRDVLNEDWLARLRTLAVEAHRHPTMWDVMYSRALANFYCAQKAIFLHHTSKCGRQLAGVAPTTAMAAELLDSRTLRVAEPTEALANFRSPGDELPMPGVPTFAFPSTQIDGCGSTAWHRDDKYFSLDRRDSTMPAVVRFWIPLVPFTPAQLSFQALNCSLDKMAERRRASFDIQGTDFGLHHRFESQLIKGAFPGHVIDGGADGPLRPGDVFAFAGETPHLAQARNCSAHGACLRLILSFAGDNAIIAHGRNTGLIPLQENQTVGAAPQGMQYPSAIPFDEASWEWQLCPSTWQLVRSFWWSVKAGFAGFWDADLAVTSSYLHRVKAFSIAHTPLGLWDAPMANGEGGSELVDLMAHFGISNKWSRP